jgi:CHAD domain-containing protein
MRRREQGSRRKQRSIPDATQVLAASLMERWDRFQSELDRARRQTTEPAVHDLRVAARRLIAVMTVVETIVPAAGLRKPIRLLRRHLKGFNDLRDVQVQIVAVRPLRQKFPVVRSYEAMLRGRRAELVKKARTQIGLMRRDEIRQPVTKAGEALYALYGSAVGQQIARSIMFGLAALAFAKVLERRSELSAVDPGSIHRMRVSFKKFRYVIELARPIAPWVTNAHGKGMNAFQTAMGEIQDLQVLMTGLRKFSLRSTRVGASTFLLAFRYLSEMRQKQIDGFLQTAGRVQHFWR